MEQEITKLHLNNHHNMDLLVKVGNINCNMVFLVVDINNYNILLGQSIF